MFSFAMTSGLASDFDKFKIIITLRRAQKFGDTGPYKNFDSSSYSYVPKILRCAGRKNFIISYYFIHIFYILLIFLY